MTNQFWHSGPTGPVSSLFTFWPPLPPDLKVSHLAPKGFGKIAWSHCEVSSVSSTSIKQHGLAWKQGAQLMVPMIFPIKILGSTMVYHMLMVPHQSCQDRCRSLGSISRSPTVSSGKTGTTSQAIGNHGNHGLNIPSPIFLCGNSMQLCYLIMTCW